MNIRFQSKAHSDVVDAYWYYEGEKPGLGDRFEEALEYCLCVMRRHPRAYEALEGEVRRGLLRKFPFGVWYVVAEDEIVVIAVLHTSRHWDEWRKRV